MPGGRSRTHTFGNHMVFLLQLLELEGAPRYVS